MKNIDRWKIAREVFEEWNNTPNCNPASWADWIRHKTNPNDIAINMLEDKLLNLFGEGFIGRDWIEKALKDTREEMRIK